MNAYRSRNLWSGFLLGIGIVAFIDEAVFHQLLHWHHFYDQSTTNIGLISDGIFHAVSWFSTVGAMFLYADLRRRDVFWAKRFWGGVLFGAGSFQLYDGIIQHKVMKLHQIRYVENLYLYDIVWNLAAIVLIFVGLYFVFQTQRTLYPQKIRTGTS